MALLLALSLLTGILPPINCPQYSEVFNAGKCGFPSVRIPSIIVTKTGTILAIAEGRARQADQADNKLLLRRSFDCGKTWSEQQVIADSGSNCLNNPCTVMDERTGRTIVMFQSYPAGVSEHGSTITPGLESSNTVRNCVITSDDGGHNWSKISDVTSTTKYTANVNLMASGPGIGIQIRRGPYKGRIIIPFNAGSYGNWNVFAVYSDDGGQDWCTGQPAPGCSFTNLEGKVIGLVNEVQMVELSDGSIMLNCRNWGGLSCRKSALSNDGGVRWSPIKDERLLSDSSCMASIFRYSFGGPNSKNCMLFSGPVGTNRENGTVRASFDDGKTWPVKKLLVPGSFAYSVLTELPDGTVGCLFETDDMTRIKFARFSLAWLEND